MRGAARRELVVVAKGAATDWPDKERGAGEERELGAGMKKMEKIRRNSISGSTHIYTVLSLRGSSVASPCPRWHCPQSFRRPKSNRRIHISRFYLNVPRVLSQATDLELTLNHLLPMPFE